MRCPVLLLLVTRVAWVSSGNIHVGAAQSPTAPDDGSARQDPGAPGLVQTNSPRKVPGHPAPDPNSNSSPCPDPDPCPAQAAPSILDIFPQDLLTSRCSESFSTLNQNG